MTSHPHIRTAMASDIGKRRHHNQDSGVNKPGVYIVCDGMGGGVGGEQASAIAAKHFASVSDQPIRSRAVIKEALDTAQRDIYTTWVKILAASPAPRPPALFSPHDLPRTAASRHRCGM